MITCAIIGAGASGVSLVVQLMKQAERELFLPPLKLVLIEKNDFAQGVAYSTMCESHLLNIPAQFMSLFPEEPKDFLHWAQKEMPGVLPNAFLSRATYGRYLDERLKQAKNKQTKRCSLDMITGEVTALIKKRQKYSIRLKSGKEMMANWVVLATGNFPPKQPPLEDKEFLKSPLYCPDPWKMQKNLFSGATILIIGSGLTMVDKVLELQAEHHHLGEIHVISRRGLLPRVYNTDLPCWNMEALPSPENFKASKILSFLKQEIKRAEGQHVEPLRVIYTWIRYIQTNWVNFPKDELSRMVRHLQTYYTIYAQPIPQESDAQIQLLIQQKRLHIHAAHLIAVQEHNKKLNVKFRPRHHKDTRMLSVDFVINALSPAKYFREIEDPFFHYLISKGYIRETSCNLDTRSLFNVIDSRGNESEGLFACGSLKKQPLQSAISIPQIVVETQELAKRLINLAHTKGMQ